MQHNHCGTKILQRPGDLESGITEENPDRTLNNLAPVDYDTSSPNSIKPLSLETAIKATHSEQEEDSPNSIKSPIESIAVNSLKNEDIFWVDFEPNDPREPINFSHRKKWAITLVACFATYLSGSTLAAFSLGYNSMIRDLKCTEFQATLSFSAYGLGLGVVPMVISSLSEEFGRLPLFLWSSIGFELCFVMIALAPNIQVVILGRFLQGGFSSTGATMVGGTISDIWPVAERGLPLGVFALISIINIGVGPVMAGWIEMNPKLEWKWIEWVQMTWAGAFILVLLFWFPETRSTIVLEKMARGLRKKSGDTRYKARIQKPDLLQLVWISCKRPIRLLFTEPIIASFSLWITFDWGILYCLLDSIPSVFQDIHNFTIGQTGLVYITMIVAAFLGFFTNFYQERLYRKYYPTRGTEARLFSPCFAAVLLPVGMFIYAWCSFPSVHWIGLCIGITVFMWGAFIVWLSVFSYLVDCYGPYASSALAGQSLMRSSLGTMFPLFVQPMYHNLTYKWSYTLFGCIALLLMPIPFILFYHGPKIRMMSKFSRKVIEGQK